MDRTASVKRTTKETQIIMDLNLDGKGVGKISLVATFSGKKYSKETEVVIKKAKSSNRGTYGSDNRGDGVTFKTKLAVWIDKLNAKWSFLKAQLYYWWLSQKRWQKIILMMTENHIDSITRELFENLRFTEEPRGLYDPLRYMMEIGGKRIRPRLCLLAYSLFR